MVVIGGANEIKGGVFVEDFLADDGGAFGAVVGGDAGGVLVFVVKINK